MQSGHQPATRSEYPQRHLASFIGTLIAILTLTLPLLVIAHYSQPLPPNSPPAYSYQER